MWTWVRLSQCRCVWVFFSFVLLNIRNEMIPSVRHIKALISYIIRSKRTVVPPKTTFICFVGLETGF